MTVDDLIARYPDIPWRKPVPVVRTDGAAGYACRICIALVGLRAADIDTLPQSPEAVDAHIRTAHP